MAPTSSLSPIRLLPPSVSERIAAGEVIENPAAVVRELVENSLDAGARAIAIDIDRGGLQAIRVVDDGAGIPADSLALAVARHATSKIQSLDDLAGVASLGFRGEALASIAAVADLTLLSRPAEAATAARLRMRFGETVESGPAARAPGTTATVRDLFATLPARRRFLREPAAETAAVAQAVRRLALARPDVRLVLRSDGRVLVQTGGGGRRAALGEIFGAAIAAGALEILPVQAGPATVSGYLSNRGQTRPNRLAQIVVVNGRPALPAGFARGLEVTYRALLPRGRHPLLALWIDLPAGDVDANVHPSKQEVRLRRERDILAVVAEVIRDLLGREPALAALDGDFLFLGRPADGLRRSIAEEAMAWEAAAGDGPIGGGSLPVLRSIGQVQASLLLAESAGGLLLFDQHRVHETILWHRLRAAAPDDGVDLAEPLVLHLPGGAAERHGALLDDLLPLGFDLEQFGDHAFLVRRVPAAVAEAGVPSDLLLPDDLLARPDGWRERLLAGIACRTALPKGRDLAPEEQAALLRGLDRVVAPAVCPHGSPVILRLSDTFLERQFRW